MRRVGAAVGVTVTLLLTAASVGPASGSSSLLLPVVHCPTSYGFTPTAADRRRIPKHLTSVLPNSLARRLSFYSNGRISLLAPRGWHCSAGVGSDGNQTFQVLPPYVTEVNSTAAGISGYVAWNARAASPDTCAFFPELIPDLPCGARIPIRERVTRLGTYVILFEDPPGVKGNGSPSGGPYPAESILTVNPHSSSGEVAANQDTCTLPQTQHALCKAILNDFRRRLRP